MALTYTSKNIVSGDLSRTLKTMNSIVIIDGLPVNRNINSATYTIEVAYKNFASKGYVPPVPGPTIENQTLEVLNAIGCSVGGESKTYSLIGIQADTETIANPNIINEKEFEELINKAVSADDKFVSADDPFWNLDEPLARKDVDQRRRIEQAYNVISIRQVVSDTAAYNMNSKRTTTLKQFKD